MYEFLENQIRPVFEKKYMDKFKNDHTYICRYPIFLRANFWIPIVICFILLCIMLFMSKPQEQTLIILMIFHNLKQFG